MISIEKIHHKLIKNLGVLNNKSVLDYGSGHGGLIKLLLQQNILPKLIYAVDCDNQAIKKTEEIHAEAVKQGKLITKIIDNPKELGNKTFDSIICHNVIECIANKEEFLKELYNRLNKDGTLIISHHDFDSAIYNSGHKDLTRSLIHFFADQGESWQSLCDGQIGRKLPGIFKKADINSIIIETWRMVETTFNKEDYSYLMSKMILEVAKNNFNKNDLNRWLTDLKHKSKTNDFYFAIDVISVKVKK